MSAIKNNVWFFLCNDEVNIITAIKNDQDNLFKCFGQGNKAFKKAMSEGNKNQTVHQVKIHVSGQIERLYSYVPGT